MRARLKHVSVATDSTESGTLSSICGGERRGLRGSRSQGFGQRGGLQDGGGRRWQQGRGGECGTGAPLPSWYRAGGKRERGQAEQPTEIKKRVGEKGSFVVKLTGGTAAEAACSLATADGRRRMQWSLSEEGKAFRQS